MWLRSVLVTTAYVLTILACSSNGPEQSTPSDAGASADRTSPDRQPEPQESTDASGAAPKIETTPESVTVNGMSRTYILGVPSPYDASRKYPLVMVLHGTPGTAESMVATFPFDG